MHVSINSEHVWPIQGLASHPVSVVDHCVPLHTTDRVPTIPLGHAPVHVEFSVVVDEQLITSLSMVVYVGGQSASVEVEHNKIVINRTNSNEGMRGIDFNSIKGCCSSVSLLCRF